jgi:galactose-1-phosphate uridylyltransferase
MPELRQNFFTKEWVIIATERARRPERTWPHIGRPKRAVVFGNLPILAWQRK